MKGAKQASQQARGEEAEWQGRDPVSEGQVGGQRRKNTGRKGVAKWGDG